MSVRPTPAVSKSNKLFRSLPKPPIFRDLPLTGDALFDHAIRVVFEHEGVYANDPADPGGATKYGISLKLAQRLGDLDGDGKLDLDLDGDGDVDAVDIRQLIPQQAARIYKTVFYSRAPYQKLPHYIAVKTFDLAVNMGSSQAHKILQRAIKRCGFKIDIDGVVGMQTINATRTAHQGELLDAIRKEAAIFYRALVRKRPRSKKYLTGWLARADF